MKHLSVYIWSSGLETWEEAINSTNDPYFIIRKYLVYFQYKKKFGSDGSLIIFKDKEYRYSSIYICNSI